MSYCVEKGIPHDVFLSWDPTSRAKTIAYLLEQAEVCQLCGTAEWEWKENKFAYSVTEKFCQGCYLKAITSEGAGNLPGTTVNLVPSTPQVRAQQLLLERRRERLKLEDKS